MSTVLSNMATASKYSLIGKRVRVYNSNNPVMSAVGKIVFQNEIGIFIQDEDVYKNVVMLPWTSVSLLQLLDD